MSARHTAEIHRPPPTLTPLAAGACVAVAAGVCAGIVAAPAAAQIGTGPIDTTAVVADSSDLVGLARAAQSRFERRRHHYLPVTLGGSGGACDETVGRFCTWYGEGEWYPQPERPEVAELRAELLLELDTLQRHLPADPWILGQRVWYRAEGGDWAGALRTARACGAVEAWWCDALQGFALHVGGRHLEAEVAFDRSMKRADPGLAVAWALPRRALDSEARRALERAEEASPDSLALLLDRLWTLADPLYMVPGNDRRAAHYARWTITAVRSRARNPFRISWGRDLEELTVRHGWEIGWERSPSRDLSSLDDVIGHKHPEGRDYLPPGSALLDPVRATRDDLRAERGRPRSLYAPDYAPVLLPMEGQIAVFPRGEKTVLVSTHYLPPDTTFHAAHDHDLPWLDPGEQADMADRIGVFAVAPDGTRIGHEVVGRNEGALMLPVPTGPYVVSAETWSPSRRRAGRARVGTPSRPAPEDVATLSDILLLRPLPDEPTSLEEVLDAALPRPRIRPGETFAIAWEVAGLGFRPEMLVFEVSVERDGVGIFRRIGQLFGLADRPRPLRLSWEEPGPSEPGVHFRYLDLDLPPLDEGEYEIRLVLSTAERTDATTSVRFEVRREEG